MLEDLTSHTRGSIFALVALAFFLLISSAVSVGSNKNSSSDSVQPLLGRWDLAMKAAVHVYPSWLELRRGNGKLMAQMLQP
jgi:hypothetical protein